MYNSCNGTLQQEKQQSTKKLRTNENNDYNNDFWVCVSSLLLYKYVYIGTFYNHKSILCLGFQQITIFDPNVVRNIGRSMIIDDDKCFSFCLFAGIALLSVTIDHHTL